MMIGGFGRGGVPFTILEQLAEKKETLTDLTLIKNDANEPNLGIGMLLANLQVKKLISTHIGLNPAFIQQMNDGEIACELIPQGIFAEKIRAGGAGIPAFLTDVGLNTTVEEGKTKYTLDGKEYLLERSLRGDVALLCADIADTSGNCWWRGTNRNMSVVMGTACDRVIVEAKKIVEPGELVAENVHLPCVFVDAVVQAEERAHLKGTAQ